MTPLSVVATLRAAGCVFAEEEAALLTAQAATPGELDAMVIRRVHGEPLEYILGWAEFCGLRIAVAPGVFVPRRRTAFLVDLAATWVGSLGAAVVVDLCCGSGAVGAALAARVSGVERSGVELHAVERSGAEGFVVERSGAERSVELHAADIDPAAIACARSNAEPFSGRCYVGDLWGALPRDLRGRVDVVVVNAPYVPTGELELMPREAREYEARAALDGGTDGLDLHRRVAAEAGSWLAPDGRLFIETSVRQAALTAEIFAANGLRPRVERRADDDATVVVAARA